MQEVDGVNFEVARPRGQGLFRDHVWKLLAEIYLFSYSTFDSEVSMKYTGKGKNRILRYCK